MGTYNINSQRGKTFKILVAAFVVLAIMTGVLFVPGTLAADGDIEVVLKAPNGIISARTIEVKASKSETIGSLSQVYSTDASKATVEVVGSGFGNVKITGVSAGVVSVAAGNAAGTILVNDYQITDSGNISAYTIKNGGLVVLAKASDTAKVPVETVPSGGSIAWKSLNSAVASVNETTGTITANSDGLAIVIGEFTDKWGVERDLHIQVVVGNIDIGTGGGNRELIEGDNGSWYKPVGQPPNIYEKVDSDGNSLTEPSEYVYNPSGKPGNSSDKEAVKEGGTWYVQDPENIWTPVNPNGSLNEEGAIWGGPDGKPGGGDDWPVTKFGGSYWLHLGQNVWKEVEGPYNLGDLTGGGPDMDPTTDPVKPIFDNTANDGKFYVGPLEPGGSEYYYGDPAGGNGTLDSTATSTEKDDVVYRMDNNGNMVLDQPGTVTSVEIIGPTEVYTISPIQYLVIVHGDNADQGVHWELQGNSSEYTVVNNGMVFVASDEAAAVLTLKATSTADSSKFDTISISVIKGGSVINGLPGGVWDGSQVGKTFNVDGRDWIVIKADGNGNLLIVSATSIEETAFKKGLLTGNKYEDSDLRTLMDSYYSSNKWPILLSYVKGADIPCEVWKENLHTTAAASSVNESSTDYVFALSASDINTSYFSDKAARKSEKAFWLRSSGDIPGNAVFVKVDGSFCGIAAYTKTGGARPAMWIGK
ncbi:MAG: hypothetical protein FWG42_09995 [Clostridiales bacterium]|nr:hypothetical protein [Clostridiales bacterium]